MEKKMSDAAYISWLFRMAEIEKHHPVFWMRSLRFAMQAPIGKEV